MNEELDFIVGAENNSARLDLFLTTHFPAITRSFIQRVISEGNVKVNEKTRTKTGFGLCPGDRVHIVLPAPVSSEVLPEAIQLDILYEDQHMGVVNKARGMVVHPAAGNRQGTLVNALLAHCRDLSGINGVIRPGIVHRIDKDTSGVMLFAKTDRAHVSLAEQIKSHSAVRGYIALVHGNISQDGGRVEGAIGRNPLNRKKMAVVSQGGKAAVTHFQVLERLGRYTLVTCRLETGRTHQIRVHMAYIGHPVVGDPQYGPSKSDFAIKGQALHSSTVQFRHPVTGEPMEFSAALPQDMQDLAGRLRNER